MIFSYADCLTAKDILADALVNIDDEKEKLFSHGWYVRQVKTGLEKLNFKAPFIPRHKDVPLTADLVIPIPKGVWGLNDLFIWNPKGDCEDACKVGDRIRLFHKRNMQTGGYLTGYTSRHMTDSGDYLNMYPYTEDSTTYYYNVVDGNFMLSDACISYTNLRIHYNGVLTDIDAVKFIPPFVREALIGYVTERAFFALKARDVKYRVLWSDAHADLFNRRGNDDCKWDEAHSLLKKVDKKVWDDVSEYLGRINA
jgi:hypothetical protein